MLGKRLNYKDKCVLVKLISKSYLNSISKINILKAKGISEDEVQYKGELSNINLINTAISQCSDENQKILKKEFFSKREAKWYLEYYAKSTFYRLKKHAIEEFIDCLNI